MKKETFIISLGGSLIVPNGGINTSFLKDFNHFIREKVKKGQRFFIICGGGATARGYQTAAREIGNLAREDVDWIGIHATRLNAHLLRTIFRDIAHSKVIENPYKIEIASEPVIVAAGWKPGWSTDYIATILAKEYAVKVLLNLSDIDTVYDKDPNKFPNALSLSKINWVDFRKIVGDKWNPGLNVPFDPVAAKMANEEGLTVVIIKGTNFENLEKFFAGKKFVGTVIK
ncbi:MAG: UMP kinase [bacterium]|nr:UMP kinase [bacterium]